MSSIETRSLMLERERPPQCNPTLSSAGFFCELAPNRYIPVSRSVPYSRFHRGRYSWQHRRFAIARSTLRWITYVECSDSTLALPALRPRCTGMLWWARKVTLGRRTISPASSGVRFE